MTKRQQRISAAVKQRRADILAMVTPELQDKPVGFSTSVRLTLSCLGPIISVLVTKTASGLEWREYDPLFYFGKGRTAPKSRSLA